MTIKTKTILFNRFVKMIEENHDELTQRFMNDLLKNPETVAFRKIDREFIYTSANIIYKDLSKWLDTDFSKEKISERYMRHGREMFASGVPFSQAQKAVVLQKRYLWIFVLMKLPQDEIAYREAMDLNNKVTVYFDRAVYFILRGYEKEMYREI